MKTELVNGVECVLVPYNSQNVESNKAQIDLVSELGFVGGYCGLCPIHQSRDASACSCPHALANHGKPSPGQFTYFPLKYWPILAMRIKGEEP